MLFLLIGDVRLGDYRNYWQDEGMNDVLVLRYNGDEIYANTIAHSPCIIR